MPMGAPTRARYFCVVSESRAVWIHTIEAAQILGTDVATVYELIDDGRVAATRIGLMTCIKLSDLLAFIDMCSRWW